MPKHNFAVILRKDIPQEFLALMDGYSHNEGGILYIHCTGIEFVGAFVLVSAVKADKDSLAWPVHMPLGYVIAIADMSVPHAGPGFLSAAQ